MNLADIRNEVNEHLEALRDLDGPVGCYRCGVGQRSDLYSSIDVVLMRTIMGEDLATLCSPAQREAWCQHLNSYACYCHESGNDGSYEDTIGHGKLHANGQIIGALGVFGLFQRLLPEEFTDSKGKAWTDIFSDRRFYRTAAVERLERGEFLDERKTIPAPFFSRESQR